MATWGNFKDGLRDVAFKTGQIPVEEADLGLASRRRRRQDPERPPRLAHGEEEDLLGGGGILSELAGGRRGRQERRRKRRRALCLVGWKDALVLLAAECFPNFETSVRKC